MTEISESNRDESERDGTKIGEKTGILLTEQEKVITEIERGIESQIRNKYLSKTDSTVTQSYLLESLLAQTDAEINVLENFIAQGLQELDRNIEYDHDQIESKVYNYYDKGKRERENLAQDLENVTTVLLDMEEFDIGDSFCNINDTLSVSFDQQKSHIDGTNQILIDTIGAQQLLTAKDIENTKMDLSGLVTDGLMFLGDGIVGMFNPLADLQNIFFDWVKEQFTITEQNLTDEMKKWVDRTQQVYKVEE